MSIVKHMGRYIIALVICQFMMKHGVSQLLHTHKDTLRGSNGIYRKTWDVLKYEITVKPDYNTKSIEGKNRLVFFDKGVTLMQIDLQQPMQLDSATDDHKHYSFTR